jgi:radical SAM superfamily enzyme YgiQ (UPF0313 family)
MPAQLDAPRDSEILDGAKSILEELFPEPNLEKVLLVTPPDADNSLFNPEIALRGTYSNFPPYGLALLAHVLESTGVETHILNLNQIILKACHEGRIKDSEGFENIWKSCLKAEIDKRQPDFIGVTCMFTMTLDSFKAVCEYIGHFGIPLVIGGVAVTNDVENILDEVPEADIAVLNEGEVALKELVNAIRRKTRVESLGQLIFRQENQKYHLDANRRPTEPEMDIIPAFEKIHVEELSKYGVIGSYQAFIEEGTRVATSLSNRGCRAKCTFCSVRNFNGSGVRHRSVESILDELEILKNEYGIGHIMWLDDDLFKDHPRAISLFDGMVRRNLNMTWDASNGVLAASCVDDVIAASAESGCLGLTIGIESGNDEMLLSALKPATVELNLKAAEVLNKYEKIHSSAFIIIGFPNETMSMIRDTINACNTMNLDWYRIKVLQPLPNTPIYFQMLEAGLITEAEDNKGVRYMTGAYGKANDNDRGKTITRVTTKDIFSRLSADHVPDGKELEDIWFLMNYELNYKRVAGEKRIIKQKKQEQFLKFLCDYTSPDSVLAYYTLCVVEKNLNNLIDPKRLSSLYAKYNESPYWRDKFKMLGLSLDDLHLAHV